MSIVAIRAALESGLNAMSPALATAWENAAFLPVAGTPYQAATLNLDAPDNAEFGRRHRARGYFGLKLMYPTAVGTNTVSTRAELIRSTFYRGASFVSGGIAVVVEKTPEIMPGIIEGDRYASLVKVRFFANVN